MQITRFGVGHRRPEGPTGSRNVHGQVITSEPQGVIAELAFGRSGAIEPHSNPNASWFVVIEGGGFVRVGDEQTRVAAGEAVLWPAGVLHAAWTDQSHMRAIVVEFTPAAGATVIEGSARALGAGGEEPGPGSGSGPAQGALAAGPDSRYDPREGEPF